jgi:hypothetical protein
VPPGDQGPLGQDAPPSDLVNEQRKLVHVCAVYDDNPTVEKPVDGKAFRGRGWKPYIDLRQTFKRNTPGTWTLQHECREGKDENVYIPDWSLSGLWHQRLHSSSVVRTDLPGR